MKVFGAVLMAEEIAFHLEGAKVKAVRLECEAATGIVRGGGLEKRGEGRLSEGGWRSARGPPWGEDGAGQLSLFG